MKKYSIIYPRLNFIFISFSLLIIVLQVEVVHLPLLSLKFEIYKKALLFSRAFLV